MSLEDDPLDADIPQPASKNTTESKVGQIGGRGHHVTQATNVYYITNNHLIDRSLEKGYKGVVDIPGDDNEDQSNLDDAVNDTNDIPTSSGDKIIEEIAASSNDATFVNTSRTKTRASSGALPQNRTQ